MSIAITSVNGQLGQAIALEAITQLGPNQVIGLARTPSKASHLGIEVRKGDYNNPDTLTASLQGIESVLLISGLDAPDKRIQQHRNVIEAVKNAGVKKIVYNSIYGTVCQSDFDAIIECNRQTEKDIKDSGLEYSIGRNGLYLEADLEAVQDYKETGKISNCAADGRCAYTTRKELARAYVNLLTENKHLGKTYQLCGPAITQDELAQYINTAFHSHLIYTSISVEAYKQDRINVYGEFFGGIIAGIYDCIRKGSFNVPSDFNKILGRPHQSLEEQIQEFLS
ncbi:MAG: SDR family oxidoreductase [Marinilabiliaceae bacterium]|nr:SDR family oxidoreductase [Marinilabiliaceae bacterium]